MRTILRVKGHNGNGLHPTRVTLVKAVKTFIGKRLAVGPGKV